MGGCMRVRWQLLGLVGVAWGRSSRWWAGRGQIGGKGCYRPDRSSNGQMGVGYCRQDGGVGHWSGIPDRGWDGVPDTGWGT